MNPRIFAAAPLLVSCAALLLSACASNQATAPSARAQLAASSGSTVSGSVTFSETPMGLHIEAQVAGLSAGQHGFHIHEVGDCSAADATSAKGHYNPHGKLHGDRGGEHHVGDMPNLMADAAGNARLSVDLADMSLHGEAGNVTGRAVVIHADPDDYRSQPAGNSGKRIACGVIRTNWSLDVSA